jgi:hypothetical protein
MNIEVVLTFSVEWIIDIANQQETNSCCLSVITNSTHTWAYVDAAMSPMMTEA